MGTAYTPPPLEGGDPADQLTATPSWLKGPVDPAVHSPDSGARGLFQQIPTTFGTGTTVTITNDRNGTNVEFSQPDASEWSVVSARQSRVTALLKGLQ